MKKLFLFCCAIALYSSLPATAASGVEAEDSLSGGVSGDRMILRPAASGVGDGQDDDHEISGMIKSNSAYAAHGGAYPGELNLRTNLLFWVGLTPNIGLEWRYSPKSGIMVDAGVAHWSWDDKFRTYRVWYVMPQWRRYIGEKRRGYFGLQGQYGELNFMFNNNGYQGKFYGGSITGGYIQSLSNRLSLDLSIGLGFTQFKHDKYRWMNKAPENRDIRVVTERGRKWNLWGPNHLGVSLVWHLTR